MCFISNKDKISILAHLWRVLFSDFTAACLHGDRSAEERQSSLEGFKKGEMRFLVCTDVVARGLDVQGVPFGMENDEKLGDFQPKNQWFWVILSKKYEFSVILSQKIDNFEWFRPFSGKKREF